MGRINIPYILFLISVVFFSVSCRTKKRGNIILTQTQEIEKTGQDIPIQTFDFNWMDIKLNADVNNNGELNTIKGRVKIRKDSLIWISIKPDVAIIEVFRLKITPDSIHLINYLDKSYLSGDFQLLKSMFKYNINFQTLQNLFTGNANFITSKELYKVSTDSLNSVLSTSSLNEYLEQRKLLQAPPQFFQAVWVDSLQLAHRNLFYEPESKTEVNLMYSKYQKSNDKLFPGFLLMNIINEQSNTEIKIEYLKTDFNIPTEFPFSIPASYSKMN
jgi:hypothetical protein